MTMLCEDVVSLFLVGESLEESLFKCALQYCEHGLNVWFISPQPFNKLPQNLRSLDKETLKLMTLLYLKDKEDMLTHLNSVHLWHKYPQAIVVNSFENYCENHVLMGAFVMSSILDAAVCCARRHHLKKAHVLISSKNNYQNLVKMYFPRNLSFNSEEELMETIKNDISWCFVFFKPRPAIYRNQFRI